MHFTSSREFPDAEGAKFQCKWYCTLDRLKVLEPDFSAFGSTNAFSGMSSVAVCALSTGYSTVWSELK